MADSPQSVSRYANVFEYYGDSLLFPAYFGDTPESASHGAAEFAKTHGFSDLGVMPFIDGSHLPNKILTIAFPGGTFAQALCIAGPSMEKKLEPSEKA